MEEMRERKGHNAIFGATTIKPQKNVSFRAVYFSGRGINFFCCGVYFSCNAGVHISQWSKLFDFSSGKNIQIRVLYAKMSMVCQHQTKIVQKKSGVIIFVKMNTTFKTPHSDLEGVKNQNTPVRAYKAPEWANMTYKND